MKLTDFKVLSFDCYGTLIDWENGMNNAYQPLLSKTEYAVSQDQILEIHAKHEAAQEATTPYMLYRDLLGVVFKRVADELGTVVSIEECTNFGQSIQTWPAFEDSKAALRYLKNYYRLAILSNVDRESFKASNALLEVEFDYIFTAQDIGFYKPDQRNFEYLVAQLAKDGIHKNQILHAAESLFHDHIPANQIGLASAWIYRRHNKTGFGATHPPMHMPHVDFTFTSMQEMANAHQIALCG